jgi:hypothetical protein
MKMLDTDKRSSLFNQSVSDEGKQVYMLATTLYLLFILFTFSSKKGKRKGEECFHIKDKIVSVSNNPTLRQFFILNNPKTGGVGWGGRVGGGLYYVL